MTGFEFAQQFDTTGEKVIVLVIDALKKAYNMAGLDFDTLTAEEKMSAIKNALKGMISQDTKRVIKKPEPAEVS